ncbi:MAG TPA: hypothetical protein VHO48_09850 [Anaerolineaceae bacterium]|nr:hypothetical protein [Anaerolineaceae bacterium]
MFTRRFSWPLTFHAGLLFLVLILMLGLGVFSVRAQAPVPGEPFVVYFFWGNGCPHCAQADPFLDELVKKYPQIELRKYEVWYDEANQALFKKMGDAYGFEPKYVPTIFVGDRNWQGYSDRISKEITETVEGCLQGGCGDPGQGIISEGVTKPQPAAVEPAAGSIDVPLIGTVNLNSQSALVSTLLISFVDGFNPCSVWVLSMLLALTLHSGSRKKVAIIGLVFLTVTALVYALFIAGLFTVFTVTRFMGWIQVVVALLALFFAMVNIKDYFWYKEGISFTIADDKKPGIFSRIRRVMEQSQSLWGLIGATIVMAGGVSLVEFSCTAGFPVLWTNMMAAQKVDTMGFVLLLALYMFIYQLDELVIFFVAVFTLKASRLEEKQGRILKLIGGTLMLALAIVMLVKPALMDNLSSSILIFGAAFLLAGLVLLLHRKVLPAFGVWIGSEGKPRSGKHRKAPHQARH